METGEYGLTRGTCSTARRLEVVAVAGLLWIYFVVCFGCGGIFPFFFFVFFSSNFERTRPTASMRTPCLIYFVLHVTLKVMPHTAHRPSLLQEAAAAEYASRAAVYVESFF